MSSGRIPSIEGGIQPTIFDAKADILTATAADTPARLAVGANDTVLTADSTTATGLKWAAVSSGGENWTLVNTGGTSLTGASTITVSGISSANSIMILISGASAGASSIFSLRFNSDTASNYTYRGAYSQGRSSYSIDCFGMLNATQTSLQWATLGSNADSSASGYCLISGANSSGLKMLTLASGVDSFGGNLAENYTLGGFWNNSSAVTSVSIRSSIGNFDSGTIFVYTTA